MTMDENIFICDGDIEIKYTLKVNGLIPLIGSVPFYLRYYNPNDEKNYVEASFDGVNYKNITPEGDHYIIAIKDVHFVPGRMFCWEKIEVPSTYFSNGKRTDSSRYDVGEIIREVDGEENLNNNQVNFAQGIWFDFPTQFVNVLPNVGESNTIYFVPNGINTDLMMSSEMGWHYIGNTNINLSAYYTKVDIDNLLKDYVKSALGGRLLNEDDISILNDAVTNDDLTDVLKDYVIAGEGERLPTELELSILDDAVTNDHLSETLKGYVPAKAGERMISDEEGDIIGDAATKAEITDALTAYSETKELTTIENININELQVFKVRDEKKNVELRLPISVLLNAAKAANLQTENPLFGEQDGKHSIYTCNSAFVLGTTSVWINGKKYFRDKQYVEVDDKTIQLTNYLPEPTDTLYIEGYWQQ